MNQFQKNGPRVPFEHYCWCGKWGAFGEGVRLLEGKEGTWYCAQHWEQRKLSLVGQERAAGDVPPAPTKHSRETP
jgi:hypothetical protein